MSNETWTPGDEVKLQALLDRKERAHQARLAPLKKLVDDMPLQYGTDSGDVLAWLISNADAVRDTLAPFDSGVRPAKAG